MEAGKDAMRTVLHLIAHLDYSFAARQLTLLATQLPKDRFQVHVGSLDGDAPWAQTLRNAGVPVELCNWRRPIDLRPLVNFRHWVRSHRPDVVHTWDLPSLGALLLSGGRGHAGLVASLPGSQRPGWLDGLLLRRADRVLAFSDLQAESYRRAGVKELQLAVARPAIDPGSPAAGVADLPQLPSQARVVLAIGPITLRKDYLDGLWALDIVNHAEDVHHMVLAGPAPDEQRLRTFVRNVQFANLVHFTGPVAELGPLLGRADIVYVAGRDGSGVGAALEAMAAGKPVVGARTAALAEIVIEGETGFLVPAGDRATLAKRFRQLMLDNELSRKMAEAGRLRAQQLFNPRQLAERCAMLYE